MKIVVLDGTLEINEQGKLPDMQQVRVVIGDSGGSYLSMHAYEKITERPMYGIGVYLDEDMLDELEALIGVARRKFERLRKEGKVDWDKCRVV